MPFLTNWKMILKKSARAIVIMGALLGITFIILGQLDGVWGQISELGSDRVTLKTVDSGSFVGQRKVIEVIDPNDLPRLYFSFRGIPYAQPPVGVEGRWQAPRPLEPRIQPRMATQWKPPCSQWHHTKRKVIGNQDCLYLNVFTPYVPSTVRRPMSDNTSSSWTIENRNLLPVLVYIHGGEWLSGQVDHIRPDRFMTESVVLVTLNYRLGLLGFLSNNGESLKGNYGIMDQIMALRWIQDNIYRFGGNPLRVTVFGNVEYLLMTREAKGLFTSAIICPVSTSLFSPQFGQQRSSDDVLKYVAQEVGCPTSGEGMLECLRITEVESLIRVQQRALKFFSYPTLVGPVVDSDIFTSDPETLLKEGTYLKTVPVMIGSSAYEGFAPFLEFYSNVHGQDEDLRTRLREVLQIILLGENNHSENDEFGRIFDSIWSFYLGKENNLLKGNETSREIWKLFRVFGDLTFHSGHRKLVQLLGTNSKAPVFAYVFNHSREHFEDFLKQQIESKMTQHSTLIPPWKELFYLFQPVLEDNGEEISNSSNTQTQQIIKKSTLSIEEEKMTQLLIKLWVSFANYGSPKQIVGKNIPGEKWTRVGQSQLNYFVLGTKSQPLNADFRKTESKFWMSILPRIKTLSEKISELEPFPLLFWIFVGLTVLLFVIAFTLICCICCSDRNSKDDLKYGEENVVFLNRIPTQ